MANSATIDKQHSNDKEPPPPLYSMNETPITPHEDLDPLYPGDTLADRYQLTHKLGEGGYSIVFAADDIELYRQVAIKILRASVVSKDPSALARMRQENHVLSKINHQHIVKIYDFQTTDEHTFLVMEKLLGRSIGSSIAVEGPITPDRAYPLVKQILSGLEAAHQAKVLHRDIKPENILLCPSSTADGEEVAIIVDFGLAKDFDALNPHNDNDVTLVHTRTQGFVGTPRYTPPEQALGDPLGPETDLFALGLVIAEWLTGNVRLKGERHAELMANLVSAKAIDISDCPMTWRPWLQKMLDKQPSARYQSAQEAIDALDQTLSNPESGNRELIFDHTTGAFISEGSKPHYQALPQSAFLMSKEPLELDLPPRRPPPLPQPVAAPPVDFMAQQHVEDAPEPEAQNSSFSFVLFIFIGLLSALCILLFAAFFVGRS